MVREESVLLLAFKSQVKGSAIVAIVLRGSLNSEVTGSPWNNVEENSQLRMGPAFQALSHTLQDMPPAKRSGYPVC